MKFKDIVAIALLIFVFALMLNFLGCKNQTKYYKIEVTYHNGKRGILMGKYNCFDCGLFLDNGCVCNVNHGCVVCGVRSFKQIK